jgi:ATP-dependent Clp protease ATP-binding subunit ClpC
MHGSDDAAGEVAKLRRLAEELAKGRNERVTTGHLLAAIATTSGPAADLLRERRLGQDVLLRAARVVVDDAADALARAMQRARDFAARSPARAPGALHLLFALCQERNTAASRAVEQCGSDVGKLRVAAMQIAMGLVEPRRAPGPARQLSLCAPATQRGPSRAEPASAPTPPAAVPRPKRGRPGKPEPRVRFALDPKRFPALSSLGRNLTAAAAAGELDPVVGREAEMERTLDVLAKRQANNPCLVGPAGVGKTSIVRGLAQRIALGLPAGSLDDRLIVEIDASALLAGTGVRGALAERVEQLRAEVKKAEGRIVLFFDEIHAVFGGEATDEALVELRSALSKGELSCIGATTPALFGRVIESDAALARRFTPVEIEEPSCEEAILAIGGVLPLFERHHGAVYDPEAVAASVAWSSRYVTGRALPDKALSVLDLAGARAARRSTGGKVGREQIAEVVSELAGVPAERLLETDAERMLRLEEMLAERIVGHGAALARIAAVLRRNASGFRSQRPIGSFLLLGPTGVGKTETAKAVAECLFHSPHAMTRLDLSEYAEPHAVARLVGAPPGYVGHEGGGQLTEAVRRRPYGVVLLDEIEKAHRDVLEAFLQVFDEGRMTDGRGRTVDFTNTVIVLTSNLGAEVAYPTSSRGRIGFSGRTGSREQEGGAWEAALVDAARAALPPELYNRIDEVLAFSPLSRGDVALVARRMLATLARDLEETRGIRLDVSDAAIDALLEGGGFDPELGARPMRRAIARFVEAPIAEMILRGELSRGDVALLDADGGVVVDVLKAKRAAG